MKENKEPDIESLFISIITALKAAEEANTWIYWLNTFNCKHPNHNMDEIDNPKQWAHANLVAARHIYCLFKDKVDQYVDHCYGEREMVRPSKQECEIVMALRHSVEEEMQEQLETQILSTEEPQGYWDGDEYLALPESNDIELDPNSY